MRRTATTPAPRESTTQPRISQALRAIVAQTRRRSMSGAESVRSGPGKTSMGRRLLAGEEENDRHARPDDRDELGHRADGDLVANGKGRILCVQLVGGSNADVGDTVRRRDFTHRLADPEEIRPQVATWTSGATGTRDQRQHGRRGIGELD